MPHSPRLPHTCTDPARGPAASCGCHRPAHWGRGTAPATPPVLGSLGTRLALARIQSAQLGPSTSCSREASAPPKPQPRMQGQSTGMFGQQACRGGRMALDWGDWFHWECPSPSETPGLAPASLLHEERGRSRGQA